MTAIETDIEIFFNEAEKSANIIIEGSDEHLDLILSIVKPLDELSAGFEIFNEKLYNSIDTYPKELIQAEIMPKLLSLNKLCMLIIGSIRISYLYRDVRQALRRFNKSHDFFREILSNTKNDILSPDTEIDELLSQINKL